MSAIDTLEVAADADLENCMVASDELKSLLETAASLQDKELARSISTVESSLVKLRNSRRSFGAELTQIKDRTIRNEKNSKAKHYDEKIQIATTLVQKAKAFQSKSELMKDARASNYSTEGKTNDELLDATNVIQDKTFAALGRTKMHIEQAKEIGSATIQELERQRVQMHDIEDDIDVLESHLDKAEKLVVNFARRMATDKIIQFFMALNIVIVIIVVIYAGVTGKSLAGKSGGGGDNFFGTHYPTSMPSTFAPTISHAPSMVPSPQPSRSPTGIPSKLPTRLPTTSPTVRPTLVPTVSPSLAPTTMPSATPTLDPTPNPSLGPTPDPTLMP